MQRRTQSQGAQTPAANAASARSPSATPHTAPPHWAAHPLAQPQLTPPCRRCTGVALSHHFRWLHRQQRKPAAYHPPTTRSTACAQLCTTTVRPAYAVASKPATTCSTTAPDVPEASYVTAFHGSSGPSASLSHQCPSTANIDVHWISPHVASESTIHHHCAPRVRLVAAVLACHYEEARRTTRPHRCPALNLGTRHSSYQCARQQARPRRRSRPGVCAARPTAMPAAAQDRTTAAQSPCRDTQNTCSVGFDAASSATAATVAAAPTPTMLPRYPGCRCVVARQPQNATPDPRAARSAVHTNHPPEVCRTVKAIVQRHRQPTLRLVREHSRRRRPARALVHVNPARSRLGEHHASRLGVAHPLSAL